MYFLFNRTKLQVFVAYLIGALYVHRLWFYKHIIINIKIIEFLSKLFVACQRWWFQWRFWFVPSLPRYLLEEEEYKPGPWSNPIHIILSQVYCVWQIVKTPTILSNKPVFLIYLTHFPIFLNIYRKATITAFYWFFPYIYVLFAGEKIILHVVNCFSILDLISLSHLASYI